MKQCSKRDVFYLAGYDPRGHRHYYSLFKKNLQLQNKILSYSFSLSSPKDDDGMPFWEVCTPTTQVRYYFLQWNDIVREHWSRSIMDALLDCLWMLRFYILTGFFVKFIKESFYQFITGAYPFLYILLSAVFALSSAFYGFLYLYEMGYGVAGGIVALLLILGLGKLAFYVGKKFAIFWIARICVFCSQWENYGQRVLQERIESFSHRVFSQLKANQETKHYELLLIAHSVGTILGVCVLAAVIKRCEKEGVDYSALKVLTLGECIPLVSFQKGFGSFKRDLQFISKRRIIWYDFTSIIDGACFPQMDFFKKSGIQAEFTPKYLSARFHTLYQAKEYQSIKSNKYKAHFLYLFATQIKGRYDFYDFVVGKEMLESKMKEC